MTIFTGEWRKIEDIFVLNKKGDSKFAGKPVNGFCRLAENGVNRVGGK